MIWWQYIRYTNLSKTLNWTYIEMVQAYTINISHQFNDIIEYNKYAIKHSVNKGTQSVYDPSILSKIKM